MGFVTVSNGRVTLVLGDSPRAPEQTSTYREKVAA